MMKHSLSLLVATMAATTLAGCQLYFGEDEGNGGDAWTYCGQDGYYECNENDCYWRGPDCPAGMGSGSGSGGQVPGGYECKDSTDCAAGCYCSNGVCEEAGFCTQDSDCGNGYVCNTMRSSCEPTNTPPPPTSCTTDYDCAAGSYCNPATLQCEATCSCMTDADAKSQNFDYCDEGRATCLPGIDPAGDCAGAVTCNIVRPSCPEGSVALISEGCYTGNCMAINSCATAPSCSAFGNETDCFNDTDCNVSYTGINCHNTMTGTSCTANSTNCTCDSYQFASCTGP